MTTSTTTIRAKIISAMTTSTTTIRAKITDVIMSTQQRLTTLVILAMPNETTTKLLAITSFVMNIRAIDLKRPGHAIATPMVNRSRW